MNFPHTKKHKEELPGSREVRYGSGSKAKLLKSSRTRNRNKAKRLTSGLRIRITSGRIRI